MTHEPIHPTISSIILAATATLEAAGIQNARREAEILFCRAAAMDRTHILIHPNLVVHEDVVSKLNLWIQARSRRKPLPYIVGDWPFLDFNLKVGPGVLIPRPETELLVEIASYRLSDGHARVIDVGTGTGAVAIGIARLRPNAEVVAVDISPAAVEIALSNVQSMEVAGRIHVLEGDLFAPIDNSWRSNVDGVVSNPPYIPTEDISGLQPEVSKYEPRVALDGGIDGLETIQRLVAECRTWLKEGGWLLFEIGMGQRSAVQAILETAGYGSITAHPDLAGIDRVIECRWRGKIEHN